MLSQERDWSHRGELRISLVSPDKTYHLPSIQRHLFSLYHLSTMYVPCLTLNLNTTLKWASGGMDASEQLGLISNWYSVVLPLFNQHPSTASQRCEKAIVIINILLQMKTSKAILSTCSYSLIAALTLTSLRVVSCGGHREYSLGYNALLLLIHVWKSLPYGFRPESFLCCTLLILLTRL